ncbi:MAG TPA: hypothetical protein ENN64_00905 [bacterium]|nr:hypothetical protein [bacterium]
MVSKVINKIEQSSEFKSRITPPQEIPQAILDTGLITPDEWKGMTEEFKEKLLDEYYGKDWSVKLGLIGEGEFRRLAETFSYSDSFDKIRDEKSRSDSTMDSDAGVAEEYLPPQKPISAVESKVPPPDLDQQRVAENLEENISKVEKPKLSAEEKDRIAVESGMNFQREDITGYTVPDDDSTQSDGNTQEDSSQEISELPDDSYDEINGSSQMSLSLFGYQPITVNDRNAAKIAEKGSVKESKTWLATLVNKFVVSFS